MKKKQKIWVRIAVAAALIAVVAVAGYFVIFHNADVLRIENGRAVDAKGSWLIGRIGSEGDERYYKLGTVGAPRNYVADKTVPDPDGDDITTYFAYVGRNPESNPGTYRVQPVAQHLGQAAALYENQADTCYFGAVGDTEGFLAFCTEGEERALYFLMPSPYEEICILVRAALPEGAEDEELIDFAKTTAASVTPGKQLSPIAQEFKLNFLDENRWQHLWNGLKVTLEITFFAVLLGIFIGMVAAAVRSTWDKNEETMRRGLGRFTLSLANKLVKIYLTVIRGTPVVIQLMIDYYIIFSSSRNGVFIAILAFGINSGAYVAEIIRGGIMSIDPGQFEAGRSLGFNYVQTMVYIVLPQALKNVLPALANEFIVLLKETSVAGYVAVRDLTKGGDNIRGATFSPFMPLLAVAAIYLVLVMFFTWLVGKLERRLKNSER